MDIKEGHFYFIEDNFFELVSGKELMHNKEKGTKRPCFYCFKANENDELFWFVPISSKIKKYKDIYDKKVLMQKKLNKKVSVDTIIFGEIAGVEGCFLIQNIFPIKKEYIVDIYTKNNVEVRVSNKLEKEVIKKAKKVLLLYNNGMKNIIFSDINKIITRL